MLQRPGGTATLRKWGWEWAAYDGGYLVWRRERWDVPGFRVDLPRPVRVWCCLGCFLYEGVAMALKKSALPKQAGAVPKPLHDPVFAEKYPLLWEYMTETVWDDGSPRIPSSLLTFPQDGMLKGMLRDRNAGLCLWVAAHSYFGLLQALEASLGDPAAEWRADRQEAGQQAKRVQKRG